MRCVCYLAHGYERIARSEEEGGEDVLVLLVAPGQITVVRF